MRIEYQDPSEASDAINDMLAQLADVRNANRALLAQLDGERTSHAKSQEAYDNATAALADQLAEARNTIARWESHDFEDDVDDATAPILAELADARAALADMTRRKDGWRTLMRATYRAYMSEMCGGDVEGTEDHFRSLDAMHDAIRDQLDKLSRGESMWGRPHQ